MQVEIKIDSSLKEPKLIVITASMTEELQSIIDNLKNNKSKMIYGIKDEKLEVLEPSDLIRIYTDLGKVLALTDKGKYIMKQRLYEFEEQLDKSSFVRISNSEIINLKKVKSFDLSITGTICINFINNTTTYASRRYVKKIKETLGI